MYTTVTDIMPQTGNDTDTVQIVGIMETLIKENQDFKKFSGDKQYNYQSKVQLKFFPQ
jgi:hypothetical protein